MSDDSTTQTPVEGYTFPLAYEQAVQSLADAHAGGPDRVEIFRCRTRNNRSSV